MVLKILKSEDKKKVIDYVNRLPENKEYVVKINVKRKNRSIPQNDLYWLWLTCIMDETGEHKDNLHEYFKQYYLGASETIVFDKYRIFVPPTTTGLDTLQFTNYLNRIEQFAATELGIILPHPEDAVWEDFHDKYGHFI
jgi:hypothetical protein